MRSFRTIGEGLPSYGWCSADPHRAEAPHPKDAKPIPELFDPESASAPLPLVREDAAGRDEPMVVIDKVPVWPAYWTAAWRHTHPHSYVRKKVHKKLRKVAKSLPDGFGLAVWDAWRDPRLQQLLYNAVYIDPEMPPGFVNPPSRDPATPPPHATGGTVDVTLTWNDAALGLGTNFDAFVDASHTRALEDVPDDDPLALSRDLRRMLWWAMHDQGFVSLECEWWHFEYGTRLWAQVTNAEPLYPAVSDPSIV